ncbi:MAG: transporter [Chitinophagaceae bacterium]|nr:transporter [Chitinophagaceae bacterium]
MARSFRISRNAQENKETGLSVDSRQSGGRFFEKDGKPNIHFKGIPFYKKVSVYQLMLKIPAWKFLMIVGLAYLIVNLLFASLFFFIGVEQLVGMEQTTVSGKFWEAFFFSAQTLTTVGYGHLYPSSLTANAIASIEALTGLLMFALATGLMYGRFSQPKPFLMYSDIALLSPFKEGHALMFRFAPYKNHFLTNVEVKVTAVLKIADEKGNKKNNFYSLTLELSKANTLISNWTIVHPIDEKSPFYQFTKKDFDEAEVELLVFVTGYDEEYANNVVSRGSYLHNEFVYGAKFDMMYAPSSDMQSTLLHLDKINNHHPETLPVDLQP